MAESAGKLSFREKFSYGFGDLASVLYWQTFMLYFTYFYTDVFLIPASVAAAMFLISRIWDGVNDPVMGIIADRTKTKWGHFRPYLLWLCVPFAVIGVLTFTVPDFDMTGKLIWAYVTFNLMMMIYTAINIPYTALLGVISPDSNERTSVSSMKFLFAFCFAAICLRDIFSGFFKSSLQLCIAPIVKTINNIMRIDGNLLLNNLFLIFII